MITTLGIQLKRHQRIQWLIAAAAAFTLFSAINEITWDLWDNIASNYWLSLSAIANTMLLFTSWSWDWWTAHKLRKSLNRGARRLEKGSWVRSRDNNDE